MLTDKQRRAANFAGESASDVANSILADLRVRFRGDRGGQLLCDSIQRAITCAIQEAVFAARRQHSTGTLPTLAQVEQRLIERALVQCDNDRKQAAELIGISERTMYRKLREYQQEPPDSIEPITGDLEGEGE